MCNFQKPCLDGSHKQYIRAANQPILKIKCHCKTDSFRATAVSLDNSYRVQPKVKWKNCVRMEQQKGVKISCCSREKASGVSVAAGGQSSRELHLQRHSLQTVCTQLTGKLKKSQSQSITVNSHWFNAPPSDPYQTHPRCDNRCMLGLAKCWGGAVEHG